MRAFANLAAAVAFLNDVVSRQDYDALAQASHEPLPPRWVLDRLREHHESIPLPELYADWQFPIGGQEFKLGGHGRELGHIHIDFIKGLAGWEIQRVWMCR